MCRIFTFTFTFLCVILHSDVDRINAMFIKAKRWGITTDELDLEHLSALTDSGLYYKIKYVRK